jgi:hypothetical protein
MRRHSRFERYLPSLIPTRIARAVRTEHLIAARIEPAYAMRFEAWLDLLFYCDEQVTVVPFIQLEAAMLLARESSPFLWPASLAIEERVADEIEALVEPWLITVALTSTMDEERTRIFTSDTKLCELLDAARSAGFLGAAPVEGVLTDAAPYVYAQRFAAGRAVQITSPDAAYGAALLARSARSVRADLGDPSRNALARTWYGRDLYGALPADVPDVAITRDDRADAPISIALAPAPGTPIAFARPAFPSTVASFDLNDAAAVRNFHVRAPEMARRAFGLTPAPIIGGSSGRIGIIIRDDGLRAPEADIDEAQALGAALRVQGFEASVVTAAAARAESFDLIHVIGYRHAYQCARLLDEARLRGVPVVVSPHLDDATNEATWGTFATATVLRSIDDASRAAIERGVVERRVESAEGIRRGAIDYDDARVRALLTQAGAAIVASDAEELDLRGRFGFRGPCRVVAGVASPAMALEPVGALCGPDEYVLVHAAVEPRANQWVAVRAAAAAGMPIVLVGSVENGDYYQNLLAFAGSGAVWLPQERLTSGALDALYAGARVYADLAWAGRGAARLLRAAAYGCGLVISSALPLAGIWPGLAETADPASVESATTAIKLAWDRAPAAGPQIAKRTAEQCDPLRSLQAILGAYAEAAAVRAV